MIHIALAQIQPFKGEVARNIEKHVHFIQEAIRSKADLVVFPELSLTGYEPTLAKALGMTMDDSRLEVFQQLSDQGDITIWLGMPLLTPEGTKIGMPIFQPGKPRICYCKHFLHADEEPFFIPGDNIPLIIVKGHSIAPAICYELAVPDHASVAIQPSIQLYLASVAKAARGMEQAGKRLSEVAKNYEIPTGMVNCVGPADGVDCTGNSGFWNDRGGIHNHACDQTEELVYFRLE